jgi:hypothetical protein
LSSSAWHCVRFHTMLNFSNQYSSVLCDEHINFLLTAFWGGSSWSIADRDWQCTCCHLWKYFTQHSQLLDKDNIYIHCVGMFMTYLYTKLHIHNTSGSTPYHHNVTTYLFNIVVRESWIWYQLLW